MNIDVLDKADAFSEYSDEKTMEYRISLIKSSENVRTFMDNVICLVHFFEWKWGFVIKPKDE